MMKKRTTHGYFLESTQLLFKNAQDDEEISALLLPFKIDEAKYECPPEPPLMKCKTEKR